MMGYRFLDNFQMPYAATTITEFWRRWHISLSTWLRDYLYIPLGGNRRGAVRTYVNLMLTMLLGGLWHGASWNFVIWGGLHGVALAAHKFWLVGTDSATERLSGVPKLLWETWSRGLTLGVVLLGWIVFRARTFGDASQVVGRIFSWETGGVRVLSIQIIAALVAIALVHLLVSKRRNWAAEIP